jgi:hypothetical protein
MRDSFRSGLDAACYCNVSVFVLVLVLGFALAWSPLEEGTDRRSTISTHAVPRWVRTIFLPSSSCLKP